MVFRKINSETNLKNLKKQNYLRMKHFNYITKPNYIKENPLYISDFLTYDFYEINKTPKQQTQIKTSVVGDVNFVRSEVDNICNFKSSVP